MIRNHTRGMTLIEIMVTTAIGIVVFGLALGIIIESDRATKRLTQVQAAAQYCNLALGAATQSIESAVAADNIDLTSDTQALVPMFNPDQLEMLAYRDGVLYRARISQKPEEGLMLSHEPVGAVSSNAAVVQTSVDLGGLKPAGFAPTIKFAYAGTTLPGQRPKYQDRWTSPGWPALIQVKVEAKIDDQRTISLETAAVPGLVAARPVKEARP